MKDLSRWSRRNRLAFYLALFVGLTFGPWLSLPADRSAALASPGSPSDLETARALSNAFADAAEGVLPSVVTITSVKVIEFTGRDDPFFRFFHSPRLWPFSGPQERRGLGSGVIVREDGIILTNNHVVEGADELTVLLSDGRTFEAETVGRDPKSDLAVIRLLDGEDEMGSLPVAELGNSDGLRVGDWVIAVGSPFRLSQTVTAGIVSATGRADLNLAEYEDFIQTDAAINPGNSGGAMVNLDGQVVGINTAIATRTGAYQGIGFAIPANMASQVMESILTHGRVIRGFLGVYIQDIDKDLARALDLDKAQGSLISEVTEGGAADKAGLEEGDVILEVNGVPVEKSKDLRFRISGTPPGSQVDLKVLRDGRIRDITVVLDERPDEDTPPLASAEGGMEEELGLSLARLTSSLRTQLDLEEDIYGALVEEVRPGSPASKAGLRQGDVIQEAHRSDVETPGDFWQIVERVDPGETILLRVLRGGQRLFIGMTLPS